MIDDAKRSKYNYVIDEDHLTQIATDCKALNYEVLSCLINLVLLCKSKKHFNYALNDLMCYKPTDYKDFELLNEALSCIYFKNNTKESKLIKKIN